MRTYLDGPIPYDTYSDYTTKVYRDGMLTCAIAGALVMWVILSVVKSSNTPMHARDRMNPMYYPNNVLEASARLVHTVSARAASLQTLESSHLKVETDKDSRKIAVADCKDGEWKSVKEGERAQIDADIHTFLKKHAKVVMMVYAPWCNHCHQTMPEFVKLAKHMKGAKMLIVNAETCDPKSFSASDKTIFELKYFPTFLVKNGNTVTECELSNLANETNTADAADADADADDDDADDAATEDTAAMLQQFF
jgi:thiol-disulfide isomerase/thioredoxin